MGVETILPAVLIALEHLDSVIDLVAKAVGQAPTQEQLADELQRRGERLLTLASSLAAKQAERQKILDARLPPKVTP